MSAKLNRLRGRHRHAEDVVKLLHKTLKLQSRDAEITRRKLAEARATLDRMFIVHKPSEDARLYRFTLTLSELELTYARDPNALVMHIARRMVEEMGIGDRENAARRIR